MMILILQSLERLMMNKINDRDIAELNSFGFIKILIKNRFKVNGKKFRQVDEFKDNINSNFKVL